MQRSFDYSCKGSRRVSYYPGYSFHHGHTTFYPGYEYYNATSPNRNPHQFHHSSYH